MSKSDAWRPVKLVSYPFSLDELLVELISHPFSLDELLVKLVRLPVKLVSFKLNYSDMIKMALLSGHKAPGD